MDNPEKLATYGTQDEDTKTKQKQSRETGNIWHTRRRHKNKTKTQHNMRWTPLYANKHK